jgi:hypothetical protein
LGDAKYEHEESGGCIDALVVIMISPVPVLICPLLGLQSNTLLISNTIFGKVGYGEVMVPIGTIHDTLEHVLVGPLLASIRDGPQDRVLKLDR